MKLKVGVTLLPRKKLTNAMFPLGKEKMTQRINR